MTAKRDSEDEPEAAPELDKETLKDLDLDTASPDQVKGGAIRQQKCTYVDTGCTDAGE